MPPPPIPANHAEPSSALISRSAWPAKQTRMGRQQLEGPKIHTPGSLVHNLDVPDFFAGKPLRPGYQEAHNMYNDMRNHFAQRAYSSNNFELVVVKVTMMSLKPGNKNPSIVSVSMLTLTNRFMHHF